MGTIIDLLRCMLMAAVVCLVPMMMCLAATEAAEKMILITLEEPPSSFTNEKGEVTGVSVDFVQEIQRRIGNRDTINVHPWARTYHEALTRPNVVAFTTTRLKEREELFHWISMVTRNRYTFFTRKGAGVRIKKLDDAKKYRVGVLRGSVWETVLKRHGFTNLDRAPTHVLNVKKLMAGRFDVIYYSTPMLYQVCNEAGVDYNAIEPIFHTPYGEAYIVMSKKGTSMETVELWKTIAREIKDDGTFRRIADKWVDYIKQKSGFEAHYEDGALNYWKKSEAP